jgi:Protein of unknown function (DUF3106)
MNLRRPFRLSLVVAFAFMTAAAPAFARWQRNNPPPRQNHPAPVVRANRPPQPPPNRPQMRPVPNAQPYGPRPNAGPQPYGPRPNAVPQPYGPRPNAGPQPNLQPNAPVRNGPPRSLPEWMEEHKNLPVQEQMRQLQNEPGFNSYPPAVQQRLRNQLMQLNTMTPEQRAQRLGRVQTLRQLTPEQSQRWRDSVQQMRMLPPPRRGQVLGAFRTLRELPPDQRERLLNSPNFAGRFSPDERRTLGDALLGEPYPPIPATPGP